MASIARISIASCVSPLGLVDTQSVRCAPEPAVGLASGEGLAALLAPAGGDDAGAGGVVVMAVAVVGLLVPTAQEGIAGALEGAELGADVADPLLKLSES